MDVDFHGNEYTVEYYALYYAQCSVHSSVVRQHVVLLPRDGSSCASIGQLASERANSACGDQLPQTAHHGLALLPIQVRPGFMFGIMLSIRYAQSHFKEAKPAIEFTRFV